MKSFSNITLIALALVSVIIALLASSSGAHNIASQEPTLAEEGQPVSQLPRLFDFEYYKDAFKKKYSSLREELVRRKIVLAKAFRAFISGIAYKYKRSKFYLALNNRSDRTPEELEHSLPKIRPFESIAPDDEEHTSHKTQQPDIPAATLIDEDDVVEEFREIKEAAGKQGNVEVMSTISEELERLDDNNHRESHSRVKRNTEDESPVRENFSLDNLMKAPVTQRMTPDDTAGSREDLAEVEQPSSFRSYASSLVGWLASKYQSSGQQVLQTATKTRSLITDERFVDHSHSECMVEVGEQGDCGSCYAFSMSAVFGWLLCEQTGKLEPISEQYLIDCGQDSEFGDDLEGCVGGYPQDAGKFFEKYGLELARRYPYQEKKGQCPYEDMSNSSSMGYIRFNEGAGQPVWLTLKQFDEQIKYTPMIITVGTGGSFYEYGGGVHDGLNCCKTEGNACGVHAVVLVGHGRDDGEDYWVIRNSHGASYGEDGYIRLSKSSDCIWPKWGLIFAFDKKSKNIHIVPRKNHDQPREIQSKIKDASRYSESES